MPDPPVRHSWLRRRIGHLWRLLVQRGLAGHFGNRVERLEARLAELEDGVGSRSATRQEAVDALEARVQQLGERAAELERSSEAVRTRARHQAAASARLRRGLDGLVALTSGRDDLREALVVAFDDGEGGHRWCSLGREKQFFLQRRIGQIGLDAYDPGTLATVLALLDGPNAALADVGANIGLVSLVVAAHRPEVEVVAFEPTPALAASCRATAERNGLAIEVEELALGDEDTRMTLHLSGTDTSSSLAEGFRDAVGGVEVDVRRLDTWVDGHGGRPPTVVKIDTETTEPAVLRGGEGFVAATRPWLVVEVLRGRTEQALGAWCADHDYRPHLLLPDGPQERDTIEGDPDHEHLNWLFAPTPLPDGFDAAFAHWQGRLSRSMTFDLRP